MMTLKEFKTTMNDIMVKGAAEASTIVATEVRPRAAALTQSRKGRLGPKALAAVATMVSLSTTAFANDQFTPKIQAAETQILTVLQTAILSFGAVSFALCGIVLIFGIGGQRASENAKAWALRIVIGMAIVLMARPIVDMVSGFFSSTGGTGG